MRKNKLIVACLLVICSLFAVSSAFAANGTMGDGEITVGGSASTRQISIGLSKGVVANWINPGTTAATSQWYAAGTVHNGGNMGYATAQNLTNIMSQAFETGGDTAAFLATVPTTATSESEWANWEAQ